MNELKEKHSKHQEETGIINTYRRLIPEETKGGEVTNIVLTAVLYVDFFGNKTVYIGRSDNPQWVKKQGQKLSYDESLFYYPGLKKENYRK